MFYVCFLVIQGFREKKKFIIKQVRDPRETSNGIGGNCEQCHYVDKTVRQSDIQANNLCIITLLFHSKLKIVGL